MALPQLDRLKSQLLTSGLQQKDNALWQVINQLIDVLRQSNIAITEIQDNSSGGGGGGSGITQLTGDVLAGPGSGSVAATIAPLAVTTGKIADDAVTTDKVLDSAITYAKIQDTSAASVLLGRGSAFGPGPVEELTTGDNIEISGTTINVKNDQGGLGLNHDLLSSTHEDTIPYSPPVMGDIVYAEGAAPLFAPDLGLQIYSSITEDYYGVRVNYVGGTLVAEGPGYKVQMVVPALDFIVPPEPNQNGLITYVFYPPALATKLTEDFYGVRPAYDGNAVATSGYVVQMLGYDALEFYEPDFSQPQIGSEGIWTRLPIGAEEQVMVTRLGIPTWSDDLDVPGDIRADSGSITAGGSVTGTSIIGLGSVSAPIGTFGAGVYTFGAVTAIGEWVDVAFNAADFTANGGTTPTWTLTAPDMVTFRYVRIGNILKVQVYLALTTVASAAGNVTELRIKIPGGFSAIGQPAHLVGAQENMAAVYDIFVTTEPSTDPTLIFIRTYPIGGGGGRAFNQTANGSYFGFTIDIRIG